MRMHATNAMSPNESSSPESWTEALQRVRSEYAEMPELRLTLAQAQRLLGLAPFPCGLVFGRLVDEGYLRFTNSCYVKD